MVKNTVIIGTSEYLELIEIAKAFHNNGVLTSVIHSQSHNYSTHKTSTIAVKTYETADVVANELIFENQELSEENQKLYSENGMLERENNILTKDFDEYARLWFSIPKWVRKLFR